MWNALLVSMALFVPILTQSQERAPTQSPVLADSIDNAIKSASATAERIRLTPVSPAAQKHTDAVAQYKANGMTEPVAIKTHNVYLKMHNLIFQEKLVMLDVYIGYSSETRQIDVLGGGTEILSHETIFNPYSTFWTIAVAILIFFPLLSTTYRSGDKLVLLWEVSILATILAVITGFTTQYVSDPSVSDRYFAAGMFGSLAIMAATASYFAAKRNKPVSWHAVIYGPCMLASAAAFMFPW